MFATNATLLTEDIIKELCEISESTGVKFSFDISLDGITKETFEATRVGATFEAESESDDEGNKKKTTGIKVNKNAKPPKTDDSAAKTKEYDKEGNETGKETNLADGSTKVKNPKTGKKVPTDPQAAGC